MRNFCNLGAIIDKNLDLEKPAIIDLSRSQEPREFSYRRLNEMADGVAGFLKSRNLPKGAKIAIVGNNSAECISAYFGIMRAGMVAVLINNKLPAIQIEKIVNSCKAPLVFCDRAKALSGAINIETIVFEDDFYQILAFGNFEAAVPSKGDPAFIIFTSGTTSGEPKGVVMTHEAHLWLLDQRIPEGKEYHNWVRGAGFKQILAAPMYHMGGLTNIETVLMGHGTIVLLASFEPKLFAKAIEKYRVVSVKAVPPMLAMMFADESLMQAGDFSSVHAVHLGGAPLTQSLIEKIKKYFPNVSGRIVNAYGLTEVGAGLFHRKHPDNIAVPELSVGYPRKEIDYRIKNGILQIRTPSMLKEYQNASERLNKTLTEDGFFITNDLFRIDEKGFYYCEGRADEMFISGGENIFPSEIEAVLETHEDVEAAIAVALPDDIKGVKPYAFVVLKQMRIFSEEILQAYFLQRAPAYQLPRRIWALESIPLAATGKIDRKYLQAHAAKVLDQGLKKQGNGT